MVKVDQVNNIQISVNQCFSSFYKNIETWKIPSEFSEFLSSKIYKTVLS
jgi:hypothetical protein